MATILCLPNEVICIILSSNSISIQDFVNFCSTCKQFRDVIKDYSTFWQRKFHQRWPHLMKICEKEMEQGYVFKKDFKELLEARTKYRKTLRHFLARIRKRNYHIEYCNIHSDIYVDEEDLKLLFHPNETIHILDYYFFIDEIKTLFEHSQNERQDNLTNIYYGKKLLLQSYLNHYYLKNMWQKFINRPAEKQLVEEVIIFVRQWCLPEKDISYLYVETELDNIVQKIMQRLRSKHFMHPILSVSHKQFLFWQYNNIYENQWNYKDGRQILDTIDEIFRELFHEIRYHNNHHKNLTIFEECDYINYYIKDLEEENSKTNIMLPILFQSIARRLGICCNLIFDNIPKILHLIWEPKYNITNSDDERCFPIYDLIWEENCLSEYFLKISKITECSTIFYSSRIRVDTIKLFEILAINMVYSYLELYFDLNEYDYTDHPIARHEFYCPELAATELDHLITPNDLLIIECLSYFYEFQMRNQSTLITALKEIVYNSRDEEDCTRAKFNLNELISIQSQLSARHQFEERKPKKRNAKMKLAVGMIVTLCDDNKKTGVIIGWTKENYNIKPPLTSLNIKPSGPSYFVLSEVGIYRFFENELRKSYVPRPIKHPEIGKFFCEYRDTYYMPNEELAKEYPEDVSYLCNELCNCNAFFCSAIAICAFIMCRILVFYYHLSIECW